MPGLFSCATGIPIPPKTIVASRAGVYALLQNACWVLEPKPGKSAATDGLSITSDGVAAHPAGRFQREVSLSLAGQVSRPTAPVRARSRSTCGAFVRLRKRPLPGDWGRPPTSRFYRFSPRRKSGKSQSVYHFALLATIKNG